MTIHALLWTGSAASVVDLHSYVTDFGADFKGSLAYGIADNGSIVGYAYGEGFVNAVIWIPIPEPSSCALWGCAIIAATGPRRHRRR
jgi:hypothetical protein